MVVDKMMSKFLRCGGRTDTVLHTQGFSSYKKDLIYVICFWLLEFLNVQNVYITL